jgi:hypothetical protein
LLPVEGRLGAHSAVATTYEKGVPGGTAVSTVRLEAVVVAIDKTLRKVTLMDSNGFKQTVKVGPEAVNFDQIQVGDHLKIVATEELIVRMGKPGEKVDDDGALVALAPKGAKPGALMAESVTQTATIKKIDTQNRTATLQFEDGSTHTLPVRADVDLSQKAVGEKVVLRATQMIALSVEKP